MNAFWWEVCEIYPTWETFTQLCGKFHERDRCRNIQTEEWKGKNYILLGINAWGIITENTRLKNLFLLFYCKSPKYSDPQTICCNHSKIWTMWLYHRVMSPNDADGMANSVDPDQTAPLGAVWSGSALFAQAYLFENLGSLRHTKLWTKSGNGINSDWIWDLWLKPGFTFFHYLR